LSKAKPSHPRTDALWQRGFGFFSLTQFLGSFNDNIYKQLVLLLALSQTQTDRQGLVVMIFALPFLLFSGMAGQWSEARSKTKVMRIAKLGEIGIMALATVGFWLGNLPLLATVLFLMGAQSAFFSPAKDGAIPELVSERLLVAANGLVQMLTFLAVILGIFLAGHLMGWFGGHLHYAGLFCVLVAMAGVGAVFAIPPTHANRPKLRLTRHPFQRLRQSLVLIYRDRGLWIALIASSFFWFSGGMVTQIVNHYGMRLLSLGEVGTSKMLAAIAAGIMAGCLLASPVQKRLGNRRTVILGGLGVTLSEGLLYFHTLPLGVLLLLMTMAGLFTGLYYVPLAAFLQERPPWGAKGEVLAAVNFCKQLGILLSGAAWFLAMAIAIPANVTWWLLAGSLVLLLVWMAPQLRKLDA